MSELVRQAFRKQAALCHAVGSPLTAQIVATLAEVIDQSTQTGARILDWPGDVLIDALPLRIAGGLNALVRGQKNARLAALYASGSGDFAGVLADALAQHDAVLSAWLESAPQTNEVARSGMLWPGMIEIARRFGPRLELLELGASGGLNLNMDRYGYDFGGVRAGDPASAVQLAPDWAGPLPAVSPVEIVGRRGVDLNPLDLTDRTVADHMLAYIWPDQPLRLARAEAAIAILCAHPPVIDRADGADWIVEQLARPQCEGVTRVVYHSIALQYFPPDARARVRDAIGEAGARATPARPLAWLAMEFRDTVSTAPELTLSCWPGSGQVERLATLHPHGASIIWGSAAPG